MRLNPARAFAELAPLPRPPKKHTRTHTNLQAHYDLVSTPEGRAHLAGQGLNPYLVRVSLGLEPLDALLGIFAAALGVGAQEAAAASSAAGLPLPRASIN